MTIQERIMERKIAIGLVLTFHIPGRADLFVCYPKDEAGMARWRANAKKEGWQEIA